jgi:putative heme transporter
VNGRSLRRIALGAVSLGLVVATFVYFLPTIASYGEVWSVVKQLSWPWIGALLVATAINLATFAPPWQITLPRLRYIQATELTQATTALSTVVPGGAAAGMAGAFVILGRWGFAARSVTRAVTLTGLWNQFLNLSFPIVAVFLLTISGQQTALLATAAFVGVAVLGIVLAGFVLVLVSDRLATDVGEVAARFANWALAKVRRGPVSWGGPSFERFRSDAGDLLERRWHVLTVASLANSLSVFLVLVVSLRALDVPASQVSLVEAFAAWAFVRIIASVPITPGGIGIVELGLTGALVGFGGNNAAVVAAVLVYRFLTVVPTLVLGLVTAGTWRRHRAAVETAVAGGGRLHSG